MLFVPDVYVECEECRGRRYNRETLEVRYRGKNIYDVLKMPVKEALDFFKFVCESIAEGWTEPPALPSLPETAGVLPTVPEQAAPPIFPE